MHVYTSFNSSLERVLFILLLTISTASSNVDIFFSLEIVSMYLSGTRSATKLKSKELKRDNCVILLSLIRKGSGESSHTCLCFWFILLQCVPYLKETGLLAAHESSNSVTAWPATARQHQGMHAFTTWMAGCMDVWLSNSKFGGEIIYDDATFHDVSLSK